jgi:hypothetical protein|tara:strand:- start:1577 stop:2194 length:618 start_codon:yes stop_codon:yes gene_type:complete
MSVNLPDKWKPSKARALEFMTAYPNAKMEEVAEEAGVSKATVHLWMRDPEFVEVFYQKYMISFGSKLPSILNAMIREAEAGNVQAGRLILEHSGKLIKRVEVNNTQSPFEKFLDNASPKHYESVQEAEFTVMPERPVYEKKIKPKTKAQEKAELRKLENIMEKRRESAKWRTRAKNVGVEILPRGRKTPNQTKEWQEKVIKAENS